MSAEFPATALATTGTPSAIACPVVYQRSALVHLSTLSELAHQGIRTSMITFDRPSLKELFTCCTKYN